MSTRDIVERLRSIPADVLVTRFDGLDRQMGQWAHEAAAEIERLRGRALLERSLTALEEWQVAGSLREEIRQALASAPSAPQAQEVAASDARDAGVLSKEFDPADLIAGELPTSRAHAYEIMAAALNATGYWIAPCDDLRETLLWARDSLAACNVPTTRIDAALASQAGKEK